MKGNLTLEEKLVIIQKEILDYKPATKWEAANDRTLKQLHAEQQRLERAIERREQNA
jgi:hypothetical protein